MNIHYQTFIQDDELIKSLEELLTKKNVNRSKLTELALRKYTVVHDVDLIGDLYLEEMKKSKWNYYIAVNTTIEKRCIKQNGSFKINREHKDRCFNIKCENIFCISNKAVKMVHNHFTNEAKKFINKIQGENWKKDFINEFNVKYTHGDFEPLDYKIVVDGKENAIIFWLKNQTHAYSKTSARQ